MRIVFDPEALSDLEAQLTYLIEQGAASTAIRLESRLVAFIERVLANHPRTGVQVAERGLWESWVPGTRIVIWYRFTRDELQIVRIWHTSRDRNR